MKTTSTPSQPKTEYSGRTSAHAHKFDDWREKSIENVPPALSKQWVLNAQWTDCPVEVENDVKKLWRMHELGNDHYMLQRSIEDLEELNSGEYEVEEWFWGVTEEEKKGWVKVPLKIDTLIRYLREKGIPEDEPVIIHWWW